MEKGDLRQSINSLQSLSKLSRVSGYLLPVHDDDCGRMLERIGNCSSFKEVIELAEDTEAEGYAIDEIINGMYKKISFCGG